MRGHLRLYLAYVPENEDEEQAGAEKEQRQSDEVYFVMMSSTVFKYVKINY